MLGIGERLPVVILLLAEHFNLYWYGGDKAFDYYRRKCHARGNVTAEFSEAFIRITLYKEISYRHCPPRCSRSNSIYHVRPWLYFL